MKISPILSLLLILAGNVVCHAQSSPARKADSLKKVLLRTHTDSVKTALKYLIGMQNSRHGYWDSMYKEADKQGLAYLKGKILLEKGRIHWREKEVDKAEDCYEKALEIFLKTHARTEAMTTLDNMRHYYYRKNRFIESLDCSFKGLKLAEEISSWNNWTDLFYDAISISYIAIGEPKKAVKIDSARLTSATQASDTFAIIGALVQLGTDYHMLKNDSLACFFYLQNKKYLDFQKLPAAYKIEVYGSIGGGHNTRNEPDSAYKYLEKAHELALTTKEKIFIRSTLTGLAGFFYQNGRYGQAREKAEEALHLINSSELKFHKLEIAHLLKMIYLKEGNYRKALESYELYISIKDSIASETNRKQGLEKEFNYNLEKKESENKLLALELRQNKYILIGMAVLLALIASVGFLFLRQNRLRNEQKTAHLKQKLLRSQMNPHFIFNSLQAIQNFVLKEDRIKAENYLSSFASVMRNVLENSRMEAIPLKKEIVLLKDYLALQQLRFKNRFDYEITVDQSLDPEAITIAPMLAQPFIENAIEHGFHSIRSGGIVKVQYFRQNEFLIMEIIDNGGGMKENTFKQHRSLALEITRERIALMNRKAKQKASFIVSEAFPESADQKGVKVIFTLPLLA